MPAYKSVVFIEPVLASLAAQTYPNLHVLISVDVCSDGTAELCQAFAERHPNVTVIRQEQRRGWIRNSNALLRAADGDFVFFAFHDDPLEPRYVERLVAAFDAHPRAAVAFSDMHVSYGVAAYDALEGIADRFERIRRLMFVYGRWWVPFRGLVRSEALRRAGNLRPLAFGEESADWLWLLRLAREGEFVRVPEPLITKVERDAGVAAGWRRSRRHQFAVQRALLWVIRTSRVTPVQEARLYMALFKSWLRYRRAMSER
jgi:glycosyltransferase involved in cell wall biosynthesis